MLTQVWLTTKLIWPFLGCSPFNSYPGYPGYHSQVAQGHNSEIHCHHFKWYLIFATCSLDQKKKRSWKSHICGSCKYVPCHPIVFLFWDLQKIPRHQSTSQPSRIHRRWHLHTNPSNSGFTDCWMRRDFCQASAPLLFPFIFFFNSCIGPGHQKVLDFLMWYVALKLNLNCGNEFCQPAIELCSRRQSSEAQTVRTS